MQAVIAVTKCPQMTASSASTYQNKLKVFPIPQELLVDLNLMRWLWHIGVWNVGGIKDFQRLN